MQPATPINPHSRAESLTIGFGTTVGMWAIGYVARMPGAGAPSELLGVLMLLCLFAGGLFAGRYGSRGWRGGVYGGLLAGALNLLILGSVLSELEPNRIVPSKLLWIPGSLIAAMAVAGGGAAIGGLFRATRSSTLNWRASFHSVAIAATLLLLAAGGIVTGHEAGLAVPDWPNSYGYNMFLYPLSKMTGGIYYEHTHRLFGSLVGLVTIVLAVHTQFVERRRWVRRLAWLALLAVIVQGVMGGLRVTGRFTLSTSPDALAPNLTLAIVHGVFAQVFLCMLVLLRAAVTTTWMSERKPLRSISAGADLVLGWVLPFFILIQLALGALLRHTQWGLNLHIAMASLVALVGVAGGFRAWGLYPMLPAVSRLGTVLVCLIVAQITLGIVALVATGGEVTAGTAPSRFQVAITTTHQTVGALLLACAVMLTAWKQRLLTIPDVAADAPAETTTETPTTTESEPTQSHVCSS